MLTHIYQGGGEAMNQSKWEECARRAKESLAYEIKHGHWFQASEAEKYWKRFRRECGKPITKTAIAARTVKE